MDNSTAFLRNHSQQTVFAVFIYAFSLQELKINIAFPVPFFFPARPKDVHPIFGLKGFSDYWNVAVKQKI